MSDFNDAIGKMTTDLLTEAGGSFVYSRGATSTTITLRKSVQQNQVVDTGTGMIAEIRSIDFIGLTTAFPYDPPERGDRITGGGITYEVQPITGDKVFRRISGQMTRVHTKQIS
jgi:hypothetical protein